MNNCRRANKAELQNKGCCPHP